VAAHASLVVLFPDMNILLAVTGSIAAYKSAEVIRRLQDYGATVQVVMSQAAEEFITPLTLQALSGRPVKRELFDLESEAAMSHIELARWAEIVLIAPASADRLAKIAQGQADDLITTICLATTAQIVIAPAMNQQMWQNTFTQNNIQILKKQGIQIIAPESGSQACGEIGPGRMADPDTIITTLFPQWLKDQTVLITAGPTQEAIDPVRYLTNRSSGKMGYAIARAAKQAGAKVILITGPTHLTPPQNVECIHVTNAQQMYDQVMAQINNVTIFIAAAAVSDYKVQHPSKQKIKKSTEPLTLTLEPNPDILKCVGELKNKPFTVGFAAETENVIEHAKQKRAKKGADLIIANEVGPEKGFDSDDNTITLISENNTQTLPKDSKTNLAKIITHHIHHMLNTTHLS